MILLFPYDSYENFKAHLEQINSGFGITDLSLETIRTFQVLMNKIDELQQRVCSLQETSRHTDPMGPIDR